MVLCIKNGASGPWPRHTKEEVGYRGVGVLQATQAVGGAPSNLGAKKSIECHEFDPELHCPQKPEWAATFLQSVGC